MTSNFGPYGRLGLVFAASLSGGSALAADLAPGKDPGSLAVMGRPQPYYDARGIRAGSFLIYPSLTTSLLYDSNVFATGDNEESDWVLVARPEFVVESDWARHSFTAYGGLEAKKYFEFDDEDKINGKVGFNGRIDVQSDLTVDVRAGYAHITEDRGTGESFDPNDDLVEYDEYKAGIGVNKGFNRLYSAVSYAYIGRDYDDTQFDQDYRDSDHHIITGRLGYEISPMTSVFLQSSGNQQDFRDVDLNSEGWKAMAGVAFEPTRLMKGEFSAGYMEQDYDVYSDISTWTFAGNLEWYVTPLMTVTFDADREAGSNLGSSRLETEVGARVDYEIRRNIIGSTYVRYEWDEFDDVDRTDETLNAGLEVKYLVNPWAAVGASYRYRQFESDVVDDYDRHFVGLTATLQY